MDADIIGNRCAETLIRLQIHFLRTPPPPPIPPTNHAPFKPLPRLQVAGCRRCRKGKTLHAASSSDSDQINRVTFSTEDKRTPGSLLAGEKKGAAEHLAPTDEIKIKQAEG